MRSADVQPASMPRSSSGGWAEAVANAASNSSEAASFMSDAAPPARAAISEIDERERQERAAFIGKGAGIKPEGCTSIFVGNLPYNVTQNAVMDLFRVVGRSNIVRASVKQGKGFAHVEFSSTGCVDKVFPVVQGQKFMGRRIRLDYANKAKSGAMGSRPGGFGSRVAAAPHRGSGSVAAGSSAGGHSDTVNKSGSNRNSSTSNDSNSDAAAAGDECPLCCESLDQTDQAFTPCGCGYQVRLTVALFWHPRNVNYCPSQISYCAMLLTQPALCARGRSVCGAFIVSKIMAMVAARLVALVTAMEKNSERRPSPSLICFNRHDAVRRRCGAICCI